MSLKPKSIYKDLAKNCKTLQSAQLLLATVLINRLKQKRDDKLNVNSTEFLCCRTCLGTEQLVPIFSEESDEKWTEDLLLVTGLEIQKDDGLPQTMCSVCLSTIKNILTFREDCRKSESKLNEWGYLRSGKIAEGVSIKNENTDYLDNWDELNNYMEEEPFQDLPAYESFMENGYQDTDYEKVKVKKNIGHKKIKKKKLVPPYKCHICKKCMANPSSLKTHLNWHTGQSAYVCETCGKRCLNRTAFLQHMKGKHGLQRTDKCAYCDYMALNKEQLKIHERRHTGEQPYICAHCGAGFHRRANLVQHLPIHLAVKAVQCDLCPSTFKSAKFLATHKSRAHTNKNFSYICHICQTVYKKSFNVRKHLLKMHGIPREQQGDIVRIRLRSFGDAVYNGPVVS